jgi:hypothetical protein
VFANLIKQEWVLVGLRAPAVSWVGAAALALFTIICLAFLRSKVRSQRRQQDQICAEIERIRSEFPRRVGEGLAPAAFDALLQFFEQIPALRFLWDGYNAHILVEPARTGGDQIWAAESADVAFTDAAVIESHLNRNFYVAVPGLVTSLGLLLTFIAILIALLDVRVEQNQVQGLEGLVAGLSGKFLSSVVALAFASVFLVAERRLLHGLSESRRRLVAALDRLVPRQTNLHVLTGLRRDMEEMSVAFRHFNTDLSGKMKQSFSESLAPTLQRMTTTIEELNQLMRAAEAQKQESITGSLESVLQNLERSINSSLEKMGREFSSSISAGADHHLSGVIESLSGTAGLLSSMNAQFQGTQAALTDVVNFARSSTTEQMALGKSQVEELAQVLRALMVQLQETTGTSVSSMTAALTGVVHDLSNRVEGLSERMANTMTHTSGQATAAATTVVEQARNWSERNATQLAELLQRHEGQMGRIEELRSILDSTLVRFRDGVGEYSGATVELRKVSTEVSLAVKSAAEAAATMRDAQRSLQEVATQSATQVTQLAEANRKQAHLQREWAMLRP